MPARSMIERRVSAIFFRELSVVPRRICMQWCVGEYARPTLTWPPLVIPRFVELVCIGDFMGTGLQHVFWDSTEQRLRAPFRLVVQLLFTLICAFIAIVGMGSLLTYARHHDLLASTDKETFDQIGNMIVAPVAAALVYLSLKVGARRVENRDFSIYGMTFSRTWIDQFLFGCALAGGLITLIFAAEYLAGWIHIEGFFRVTNPQNVISVSLLFSLVKVVIVAIVEELIFRGLVLRVLAESFDGFLGMSAASGQTAALLFSALLFGAVHLTNPNSSWASTAVIFFIGTFFGLAYIITGQLAAPIGLHLAWNLFQGVVYGFPVSGDKEPAVFLLTRQSGNALVTGGSFGPEAGLLGIAAAILGILSLWFYFEDRQTPAPPLIRATELLVNQQANRAISMSDIEMSVRRDK